MLGTVNTKVTGSAPGTQPSSAEWAPFKLAWLKENEPDLYAEARWLLDAPDWLGAQLTGEFANNTCSASIRMYHDRTQGGFLHEVYDVAGCGDVFDKLPEAVNPLGTHLGNLTAAAASALGLKEGTPVAQGRGWARSSCTISRPAPRAAAMKSGARRRFW